MDRRTVLKGGLVLAATAHTAAYNGEIVKKAFDLQSWLDNAEPAESGGAKVGHGSGGIMLLRAE
ncbi:hypothetical protein [Shinella granuli]|uniref:Uncharacterized protein n=1 Tax=Shinella granuli TaxID=323621 RepID=A0A4R2BUH8_SHIGR|nr:hypothetical protein [Shinella granuli]TCN30532.1 hypothetical protein EV665_16510 [Shinella granuli]